MTKPDWRIYYDDGSTFDSTQGEPHEAPSWGFIVSLGYDQDGTRYMMQGWDYYRWDEDTRQWWGMDLIGVIDCSARNQNYAVKIGRTVAKQQWQKLLSTANDDPEFPIQIGARG